MLPSISKRCLSEERQSVVQQAARDDGATTKPEAAMATPAIGDDIIARSKAMTSATAARARSLTTPTTLSARDANETGSYCDGASRISVAMTRVLIERQRMANP